MAHQRPDIDFDDAAGVITLEGVKYAYEFFQALGFRGAPPGTVLEILKREDGVLTVRQTEQTS